MKKMKNEGIYIRTINAALIWEHNNRNGKLNDNFTGYIPNSLELKQLKKIGLDTYVKYKCEMKSVLDMDARTLKTITRFYTDDVINVKFKSKVDDIEGVIKKIEKSHKEKVKRANKKYETQLLEIGDDLKLQNQLEKDYQAQIKELEEFKNVRISDVLEDANKNPVAWGKSINLADLRTLMYEEGFTLKNYKDVDVHYVPYKRSSAKARTGEILFIREELHDVMVNWSRMGLDVPEDVEIDLAALSAYESLVASSIEGTIKINPKNILLIDDVESVFKQEAMLIQKVKDSNKNDILKSILKPDATITNSLFDGQGLLDSSYFTGEYEGKGMMLLRQHFFKSCMFNTNIEQFMKNQFNNTYETATITDMLGTKIKVKDVKCIITPSSLKVFKFSSLVGTDKQMYKHWQKVVKAEKCEFGICKSEYATKRGSLNGMPLQQMSYQMINSLPLDEQQAIKLSEFEVNYINEMKNNNDKFIEHLEGEVNLTNSNQMIIDLYERNKDIAKTEFFINFKTNAVAEYSKHIRKGKLRIIGDYLVLVGNPYEMLLHSIDKLDLHNLKPQTLQDNQIHTTLFNDEEELAGFRNPHTSSNNILYAKNVHNELINTYFNFTNNIVAVNAIDFAIQDILSGCDYDSDTMLLTNNEVIVEVAKNNEAKVCLNGVPATSNKYKLSAENRSKVDKAIASDVIGRIVNVGQAAQSIMYDALKNGEYNLAKQMEEIVEIIAVGSTIAIDLAKKSYKIDIVKELDRLNAIVKAKLKNGKYPLFMQLKKQRNPYDTSMDYVYEKFLVRAKNEGGVVKANGVKSDEIIDFMDLVSKCDENGEVYKVAKANDKQEQEILELVNEYTLNTKLYHSLLTEANDNDKKQYRNEIVKEAMDLQSKMAKRTIKSVTIYAMLYHAFCKESIDCNVIKVMNAIYLSNPKKFINIFIHKK